MPQGCLTRHVVLTLFVSLVRLSNVQFILVMLVEHLLFVAKIVMSGVVDKVPRVVREAQANLAIQRKKERKEFRRLASGLKVRG